MPVPQRVPGETRQAGSSSQVHLGCPTQRFLEKSELMAKFRILGNVAYKKKKVSGFSVMVSSVSPDLLPTDCSRSQGRISPGARGGQVSRSCLNKCHLE